MTLLLEGRRVLLTGALGTLGRAQAQSIAAAGAELVLLDRPECDDGESFARTVGGRFLGLDLGDLGAARRVAAREHIDILINNAALIESAPFETVSFESYEQQLRVNAGAAFALAQGCAEHMKRNGYGKILNFCSVTLSGEWSDYAAYVTSKGAMLGLTKALARELGAHGIRVNAISPGAIVSAAEQRVFGNRALEYSEWVISRQCLKQRLLPEAIADAVMFLISPASDGITGQELKVDGGW